MPTLASLGSPCRLVNQRRLIDPRQIEALTKSSYPQHLTTTTQHPSTSSQDVLPNPGSLRRQEALASQRPETSGQLVRQCLWLPTARSPVCCPPLPRAQWTCARIYTVPSCLLNCSSPVQCRRSHPRREPRGPNRPPPSGRQGALRPHLPHPPRRPVQHLPQAAAQAGVDQARGRHAVPSTTHQARRGRAQGEGCPRHPDRPQEPLDDCLGCWSETVMGELGPVLRQRCCDEVEDGGDGSIGKDSVPYGTLEHTPRCHDAIDGKRFLDAPSSWSVKA